MNIRAKIILMATLLMSFATGQAAILDSNFQETTFTNVGVRVTGLAWAPDGSNRLFVSRKTGEIQIVKNGNVLPTLFATLSPIYQNSECGLIGICLDPNFMVNGYVYVFVTVSSSQQQIVRYTAVGDVGTNKTVIISGLPTLGANHDGGAVGIGPDYKLYWAVGDNGSGIGVDANLTSLAAKVGRANLDGTVPSDNPFVDGAGGNNDYIWARGFRNPFTLTFQDSTGLLWVNCVGTSYEQVFQVNRGDHAGWNDFENSQPAGNIIPKIKYRTNGSDTRTVSTAVRAGDMVTFTTTTTHGFRQGERITISGVSGGSFDGVVFVASVPSSTTFTAGQPGTNGSGTGGSAVTLNQGGAITGGCFYESTGVPAAYQGNFFYGDYNSDRIMRATLSASNTINTVNYFVTNSAVQIDIAVGPDGALYYAEHLSGLIRRLAHTNFATQEIVVTPTTVRMVEGGASTVTVRLAQQPAGTVTVNTMPTSGDTNFVVTSGGTLSFNSSNWSVPQVVRLDAGADSNGSNAVATLTISSSGLTAQKVTVRAVDISNPPSVGPVVRENGNARVYFSGSPGRTYVLEGNTNFIPPWTPIFTNRLVGPSTNFLDQSSSNLARRFYRTRLVP